MPRPLKNGSWFRTPDPAAYVRYRDREDFLEAVRAEAPDVLGNLRDEVWPRWRQAYARPTWGAMASLAALNLACMEGEPSAALMSDLRSVLVAWSQRFYLNSPWLLDAGIGALHRWFRHPEFAEGRDPKRLRWAHDAILCLSMETKGGPRKRPPQHVRWLARWQVLGESAQTIAEHEQRARDGFEETKEAVRRMNPLMKPDEVLALYRRFSDTTSAVLTLPGMQKLDAVVNRLFAQHGVTTIQDVLPLLPKITELRLAVRGDTRHTPWSTIDRAVREYARRIDLPLRSHPRGRKAAREKADA